MKIKSARTLFDQYLPLSDKKKEEFLEMVKEKVDYYQPKIEGRCQLSLGDVKVKDDKESLSDIFSKCAWNNAINSAWRKRRIPEEIDFTLSYTMFSVIEDILTIPLFLWDRVSPLKPILRYCNNTMYVPFYYKDRFTDLDFKKRLRKLEHGIVHELSHAVWYKISDGENKLAKGRREWFEGFATYCAEEFFSDLYPSYVMPFSPVPKNYRGGKNKIERLISQKGEGIILEIPKRWQEFENLVGVKNDL